MFRRLLLAGALAAALAAGQGRGGGGGGEMGGEGGMGGESMGGGRGRTSIGGMDSPGGMGGGRYQKPTKFEQFCDRLKLSKEQKEEAQKAFAAALEQSGQLRQSMGTARADMATAILQGKSGDDLKKLQDNYATLSAQMTGIEAQAFAKVYATLKPNQQGKAPQAFELLEGLFDPPMTGGGGGRRER